MQTLGNGWQRAAWGAIWTTARTTARRLEIFNAPASEASDNDVTGHCSLPGDSDWERNEAAEERAGVRNNEEFLGQGSKSARMRREENNEAMNKAARTQSRCRWMDG